MKDKNSSLASLLLSLSQFTAVKTYLDIPPAEAVTGRPVAASYKGFFLNISVVNLSYFMSDGRLGL